MTPDGLSQITSVLGILDKGGTVVVFVLLIVSFWRGDLISKKAVENMIPQIVAQTISLIKPEIAAEVENQMDKLGDKIVKTVTENNRRAGW